MKYAPFGAVSFLFILFFIKGKVLRYSKNLYIIFIKGKDYVAKKIYTELENSRVPKYPKDLYKYK